jgi:hypothetical protein
VGWKIRSDVDLIALDHRPGEVSDLLPPAVGRRVHVMTADPLDIGAGPPSAWDRWDGRASDRVVTFPIDGPMGAVELAVAGLFDRQGATIAAPSTPGAAPTAWWVLDLLARYTTPAVDLRGVRWTDDDGIWWTHPTGPLHLPLVVDIADASTTVARVLRVAEAVRPNEPVTAWLDAVAAGTLFPTAAGWGALLCARYLSLAADHVCGPRPALAPVD